MGFSTLLNRFIEIRRGEPSVLVRGSNVMLGRYADLPAEGDFYDVVIVGGGAAGLTLAHALSSSSLSVAVLEAGGEKKTSQSQEFYRGEIVDPDIHPHTHSYRVRAIGGTSRIWGGRSIPFDPIDFEKRDWIPGSGWPFSHRELARYYGPALEAAEAGRELYDMAAILPGEVSGLAPNLDGAAIKTTVERFSKPTNFWRRYGPSLKIAPNVSVFTDAPARKIMLRADGRRVDFIEVAAPDGSAKKVRGRQIVLALGGLETARLMLASDDVTPGGVGNASGQLGRNYMSHLCATVGTVTFSGSPNAIGYDYKRDPEGIYVRRRLWITEEAQRELKLLNTTFRTHLPEPADPSHGDAILSSMFLVKNFVQYEYARKFSRHRVTLKERAAHLRNIVSQPLRIADFGIRWLKNRTFADRKVPSVVLGSKTNRYELEFHAEQAPNAESRLLLSSERDAIGMRRLKVDWRITPLDLGSLQSAYALLARELARTGAGRLDYDPERLIAEAQADGIVGGHHIGTTRMSEKPDEGVVDADCRVHGVDNLYVASASVFPTSGQANPTLTLIALTLRLADHLKRGHASTAAGAHHEVA